MIEPGQPNRSSRAVLWIAIFLHLAITVPLALLLNVWADEASALHTTQRGLGFAWQHALADEKQAPLYFWILAIWRSIDGSIFFARLFSIIASIIAVVFVSRLARRFVEGRAAGLLTLLLALHPFLIWTSLEVRVYSLVVCLSAVLIERWFAIYFDEPESVRPKDAAIFIAIAATALYTNYYLGFLLVGLFAALLVCGRFRAARSYFLHMIVTGIVFAPLVWVVREQLATNAMPHQDARSIVVVVRMLWNTFLTFVFPTELYPLEQISTVSLVRVWAMRIGLVAVAIISVRRFRDMLSREFLASAIVTATIAVFFVIAYFALGPGYVGLRHAAVLFVPIVLACAFVLGRILPARSWPVLLALYLTLFAYAVYALYPTLAKRGDWARIASHIEMKERPNQPIVISTAFESLALPYHYKGQNKILPGGRYFEWPEPEAEPGSPDAYRRQLEFVISTIPSEADEVWLITDDRCDFKRSCEPLENFVNANYTVVEESSFYFEKVRLLRKR